MPPLPLRLIAALPLPLLHFAGTLLGLLLWLVPNRQRQISADNLQRCFPDLTPAARRRLLRRSLIESGKGVTELPLLLFAPPQRVLPLLREVEHEQLLIDALAQQQGVIACTPHLGCWELAGLYLSHRFGITTLYRPPRLRRFEALLRTARERCGATLVPTNQRGVRALYQTLNRGGLVGVLPDQDPRAAGICVPLFGVPANTMTLLPRLIQRSGAAVVFGYAERLSWGRGYRLHILAPPAAIADGDPAIAARALNQGVERCINATPTQYLWSYQRFKGCR